MSRFTVYKNEEGPGYLMDVQANLLRHLNTRMVVPLMPIGVAPIPAQKLNPVFEIDGIEHAMVTQFMASVPKKVLKTKLLSMDHRAHDVVSALDCLFQGV